MVTIGFANSADEAWLRRLARAHGLPVEIRPGPGQLFIGAEGAVFCGQQVLTCGLDHRNTLTVSSTLQSGGMATLQREVETLSGAVRAPQELRLDGLPGPLPQKLKAAAVLLLLDRL